MSQVMVLIIVAAMFLLLVRPRSTGPSIIEGAANFFRNSVLGIAGYVNK